jgi:hypothetical protein
MLGMGMCVAEIAALLEDLHHINVYLHPWQRGVGLIESLRNAVVFPPPPQMSSSAIKDNRGFWMQYFRGVFVQGDRPCA